jgi:hypothetical protein
MQLQRSDPIFNMEVNVTRPAFNLEPKYKVTMWSREEWTRGSGNPFVVKRPVRFTDGPRKTEGTGTGVNGQSSGKRLSISLGKNPTIFQAEVYAILACVYEIQINARTGK